MRLLSQAFSWMAYVADGFEAEACSSTNLANTSLVTFPVTAERACWHMSLVWNAIPSPLIFRTGRPRIRMVRMSGVSVLP